MVEVEVKVRALNSFFGVGGWLEKWRIKHSSNLKLRLVCYLEKGVLSSQSLSDRQDQTWIETVLYFFLMARSGQTRICSVVKNSNFPTRDNDFGLPPLPGTIRVKSKVPFCHI